MSCKVTKKGRAPPYNLTKFVSNWRQDNLVRRVLRHVEGPIQAARSHQTEIKINDHFLR